LALTEFLLGGTVEASRILDLDGDERSHWAEVRANLAPYPKARGPYGEVWLDVENAPVEYIYNVPVTLAPVFPGEQVGLGLHEEKLEIARRTAETVRLEGGNDLVYQPLIRARLGMLDLNWFKREVEYCLLPNGIANDRARQSGGRYGDLTDFDFMMYMGVWTENLSLPAVLNECLLQSYTGTIRVFPNRQNLGRAGFRDLRAVGAFLVSAHFDGQNVSGVTIHSEKGATLRMENPWGARKVRVTRVKERQPVEVREEGKALSFPTQAGERYHIVPA
jgi:alpha-L-fucosidase 2